MTSVCDDANIRI